MASRQRRLSALSALQSSNLNEANCVGFLSAEFSFDGDVRNAGYIAKWIELLKADKRAFFTACSKASKAADYLRGLALAEPAAIAA